MIEKIPYPDSAIYQVGESSFETDTPIATFTMTCDADAMFEYLSDRYRHLRFVHTGYEGSVHD